MAVQQKGALEQSYDEVPYESLCYPGTHPTNTAMIAKLFGLNPPDFKKARVLELGCSGGGNLAPLALTYPNAHFTGIDFSQEEINEANALKNAAQLKNIDFIRQDILEFDIEKHKNAFDYIIAHGVFSWVPREVSAKVLQICGSCLSPNGVAFVSYNALPGWNTVRNVREVLMHHAAKFPTPEQKIRECRAFLEFLSKHATQLAGYRAGIEEEYRALKELDDFYFFHDHLSGVNFQFYFSDFMRLAAQQNLAYVGEAVITNMFFDHQPEPVVKMLRGFNDIIEQEQYLDYLTNRRFRTTLLCRNTLRVNRSISGKQALDFYLAANMSVKGDNSDPAKPITFSSTTSQFVSDSLHDSALYLELIANGQRPIAAEELIARTQKRLGLKDAQPLRDALSKGALVLVMRGYITMQCDSPPCATEPGEKPVVSPIIRYQARKKGCKMVTNLINKRVPTGPLPNLILPLMDGTRTQEQIYETFCNLLRQGTIVDKDNKPVTGDENIRREARKVLDELMPKFATNCFFMSRN